MKLTTPKIRDEKPGDEAAICEVHDAAFAGPLEGRLVNDLRRAGKLTISLLAEHDGQIVGHIAFSPVTVGSDCLGLGLAPLAVLPAEQSKGIGAALVKAGIAKCRQLQTDFVVVLGSPVYYGRFGFKPAVNWSLSDEFRGGEAFQALELVPGAIQADGGLVRYAPEFSSFLP